MEIICLKIGGISVVSLLFWALGTVFSLLGRRSILRGINAGICMVLATLTGLVADMDLRLLAGLLLLAASSAVIPVSGKRKGASR